MAVARAIPEPRAVWLKTTSTVLSGQGYQALQYFIFNNLPVKIEMAKQMHICCTSKLMRPLMTRNSNRLFRYGIAALLFTSGLALAQDQSPVPPQTPPPANGGWRHAGDPPPAAPQANAPAPRGSADSTEPVEQAPVEQAPVNQAQPNQAPVDQNGNPYPQPAQQQRPATPAPQASNRPAYGLPAQLTLKPGTFFTVRTNTMLASNKNKTGDLFTAALAQPLVVDGIVIAQRGQTVVGRVVDAGKGKDGAHFLKLELTGITLADGSQLPMQSQLATTQGGTTPAGAQAGAVVGTTAVGAGVGGIAGGGMGAGVGAGAGAIVGIAGVIATRNHPALLYPETPLTFQVTAPVTVSTVNAPQAFRYVGPEDYERQPALRSQMNVRPGYPAQNYLYGPGYSYPGYYPGFYPGYYPGYYPYYWGPSIGVGFGFGGPRFFGRRFR